MSKQPKLDVARPKLEQLPLDPQVVKKQRQYRMAALRKGKK